MPRSLWVFLLIPVFCTSSFALSQPSELSRKLSILSARERRAWTIPHQSEFSDLSRVITRWRCGETHPPQALATPDPLLDSVFAGNNIKVTFIIGTDGLVHSPLILQSAGAVDDRKVLRAVRIWRYRPATCNGIPTEAEGDIEFAPR